jgi:hypothetical protein
VRLIENGGRNVRLFMREGERWLPVCTSPCSFQAPGGPRDYAAPTGQGPVLALKTAAAGLWLTNGDGLQADFKDRKVVRKVGLCVLLGGLALLPFIAVAKDAKDREAALTGLLVPSGALSLSGVIMLLIKDRVGLTRCAGCNAQVPGAAR